MQYMATVSETPGSGYIFLHTDYTQTTGYILNPTRVKSRVQHVAGLSHGTKTIKTL